MHEKEIFKQVEKSPKYLSGNEILRTLTKVWSAYTKLIRSLLSSHKTAISQEFGKFIPTAQGAHFVPNSFFLSLGNYSAKSVTPASSTTEQNLSYSSISLASGYSKEICIKSLKEILSAAFLLCKSSPITLDLKIGQLHLRSFEFQFSSGYKSVSTAEKSEKTNVANPNDIGHFSISEKRFKSVPPNPKAIPWPYLPGFYEDSSKKLGKKFNFEDQPSPSQLLEEHKKQIKVKNNKKVTKTKEEKKEGQILANLANHQMVEDRESKVNKAKALQELFIHGNKSQIDSHRLQQEEKKVEKKSEKYDFFPFVYGSKLEEYQQQLKSELKAEMRTKMENDKKDFPAKQGITEEYTTSFPVFLKQDKYVPKRRVENIHVKAAMGKALNRYEEELNSFKVKKIQEEQREKIQEDIHKVYEEQGKAKFQQAVNQNREFLLQQIEENNNRKIIDKEKELKPGKNHFGPEESPERVQQAKDRLEQQKYIVKSELIDQMVKKRADIEQKRLKEMQNEEANAFALVHEWEKDELKKEIKLQAAKNLNREVWIKQMELKALEKKVSK